MYTKALSHILSRAVAEPDFRKRLLDNPQGALQEDGDAELAAPLFEALGEAGFYRAIGGLILHELLAFPIGEKFTVVPDGFPSTREGRIPIFLTPAIGVGNGTHASTRLSIEALEERIKPAMRVLDIGTGSGILAIAAAKLGAGKVLAVEIEAEVVPVAVRNVERNQVTDIVDVRQGSLGVAKESGELYHLILVNILARVVNDFLNEGLAQLLAPGGILIASGITLPEADGVKEAMLFAGLRVEETRRSGGWVAMAARRI